VAASKQLALRPLWLIRESTLNCRVSPVSRRDRLSCGGGCKCLQECELSWQPSAWNFAVL